MHDKKLTLVALCALLEMDPPTVPVPVQEIWSNIVAGILKVFKDLPRAIEGKKFHIVIRNNHSSHVLQPAML